MQDYDVTFRAGTNGYSGTVDTQVVQSSPGASYALAGEIGVDRSTDIQVLLRFEDLFGSGALQIPEGAEILSATLTLHTTNTGHGASLHRMLIDWSDSATWSSLGSGVQTNGVEAVTGADVVTGATSMGSSSFNVTQSVQAWASGQANYGWVFVSQGTNGWDFYSAQGAIPPQLTVRYRVADGPVNTLPVAVPDVVGVDEDGSVVIDVLSNDTDADGHVLTVSGVGTPSHGSAVLNGNGTVTYTPNANYHGSDSFTYTISDGHGGTATGMVSVTVNPVNDTPVANNDSAVVSQDSFGIIDVLANDTDIDGDELTVASVGAASHGSVVLNGDGTVTYTPNAGYHGPDSFSYEISDGQGGAATGTVTVTVNPVVPVNTPPVANPDTVVVDEDGSAVVDVLVNDTDVDGHALTVTGVGTPSNGSVVLNGNGTITYTPNANYHGPDSFTYQISDGQGGTATGTVNVTVNPVNDNPVANNDSATVQAGSLVTINVLANDTDIDGDALTVTGIAIEPGHGSATINGNGTITYTPNTNYHGPDSFTYTISDGQGGTATGTVNVTVNPVTPPTQDYDVTFRAGTNGYSGTVDTQVVQSSPGASYALAGEIGVDRSTDIQVLLRFEDLFGSGALQIPEGAEILSATLTLHTTNTGHGASLHRMLIDWSDSATWSSLGSGVQTNGVEAVTGADVVTGATSMGSSSFNVTQSVQAWASGQANYGWVFVSQGTNGWDFYSAQGAIPPQLTVRYRVADGPVNTLPVAVPDVVGVDEDGSVVIDVLSNDTDADGHVLTVSGVGTPSHGSAVLNGNGTVTYTPNANYHGSDSFTYTISDGHGGTATGMVSVTVNPVNDTPVANNDSAVVSQDSFGIIDVLANDTDIDGDELTVASVGAASHGSVVLNGDGTVTYTPNAGYHGPDSFSYEISDGQGGAATGTVTVTVNPVVPVNTPPVANPDTVVVDEDGSAVVDVLVNDTDVDGHALTVTGVGTPSNGSVVLNGNGTITYTPNANYHGPDSFTYQISDGQGGTATGTVNVTVNPVNDNPVANNDSATVQAGSLVTINVLANDTDIDGDALTVTGIAIEPGHGSATINGNGTITYTPNTNYHGPDSFTYTISDGQGGTATGTVNVTVNPVTPPTQDYDVTFRAGTNGYSGTVDTQVVQSSPGASYALAGEIGVDRSTDIQVLLRFEDLFGSGALQIPEGAEILSATLTLHTTNTGHGASLHRMLIDWSDSATWSSLGSGVQTNGVEAVTGADVVTGATSMGSSSFNVTQSVQAWASGQANYGWVFVSQGTNGWDFYSAQGAIPPQLTVRYRVADGPVNTLPVAVPDVVGVDEDGSVVIDVLSNDTDADGHVLTVSGVGTPSHGSAVLNGNGTVTYTPNANYHGSDSFTYTISDGHGGTATGMVSVTVNPVNDTPVANNDSAVVSQDSFGIIDVLANDTDIDGDELTVASVGAASHGSVVLNGDGTVTYTPNAGYHGPDSFSYEISDGQGGAATGTVTVTVNPVVPVNTPPVANPDTVVVDEDGSAVVDVLVNDTDVDGHALTVTGVGTPSNGSVVLNGNGTITYTPNANYHGPDSFTYQISDGQGGTATGTVNVTVNPVNDNPVANNDSATVQAGSLVTINVLANDTDIDGDALTVTGIAIEPGHGSATINGNGTITYTPNAGYQGIDLFSYMISDGQGGTAVATVTVNVTGDNGDPLHASYIATTISGNSTTRHLEHSNSTKSFYFNGAWWAILPSGTTWAIQKFSGNTPQPGQSGGWEIKSSSLFNANNANRADLAWDPATGSLYVLQYNNASPRLFKLEYQTASDTWGVTNNVQIAGSGGALSGDQWTSIEVRLALDQNGVPVISAIGEEDEDPGLHLAFATSSDLSTWGFVTLDTTTDSSGGSNGDSKADIVFFTQDGKNKIGIIYSRDGSGSDDDWSIAWRDTPDLASDYVTGWQIEVITDDVDIDNHMAAVSDGETIYGVIKDDDNSLWLLKGRPGAWEEPMLIVDGDGHDPSRPAIVLDAANDRLFIYYQESTSSREGAIFMKVVDAANPVFDPDDLGIMILQGLNPDHDMLDPQRPTHAVGWETGYEFIILAKNQQTNTIWYNDVDLGIDYSVA